VILVPAAVLGSLVHLVYGQQLPWLLDQPLRCQALPRALESIGVPGKEDQDKGPRFFAVIQK
jgi:hypothetical protein